MGGKGQWIDKKRKQRLISLKLYSNFNLSFNFKILQREIVTHFEQLEGKSNFKYLFFFQCNL